MPNELGEAVVPIRASFDQFDKDVAGARSKLAQGLEALGKGAALAAGAAVVGAGVAVGKFAADSTESFVSFQNQMNEVFTLLPGISQGAMDQMSAQVLQFSKDFGTLPEEVVPALYQALSAGVPPENVFTFLETAQKAAIGGVTDLETAVDGISSVVNAYGSDVISAAEASDLMFTAVKLGKTNFEELSQSLFNVIPTAASMGVGFEDITAALAQMTAQGVPTSVATTQLRQLLVELGKDGSKAATAFQEWTGQTLPEFLAEGHDLTDVLAAMDGYSQTTGESMGNLFGSVEAGNAALALSGDKWDQFRDTLGKMDEATGSVDEAFGQMNSGVERSRERIAAFWETTKIGVGESLSPLITKIAELADDAGPKMEEFFTRAQPIISDFAKEMGEKLGPAAAEILDAVRRIAEAFGIVDENADSTDAVLALLKGTLDLIVGSLDLAVTWFDNLAWGIEKITEPIHNIINAWDELKKKFGELDDSLPDWMRPGSPTPLELGVRGLTDALGNLPDFSGKFSVGMPALAGLGGDGGGMGGNITNVYVGDVVATSVGGDPVDEAIKLFAQILRSKLKEGK